MAPSFSDSEPPAASRVVGTNGGFLLSWASNANASQGYVVEWQNATCLHDCPVHWIKVAAKSTNVSLVSGTHSRFYSGGERLTAVPLNLSHE